MKKLFYLIFRWNLILENFSVYLARRGVGRRPFSAVLPVLKITRVRFSLTAER